ncbi:MAG: sortase [Anaerolineae bacterium]|nr:sortase [Anaerolineae bacterium]
MVQQTRPNKLKLASLNRFEQVALAGTILIWVGVMLFGAGLYVAFKNLDMQRSTLEQGTAIAVAATATETATPSPTPWLFPAGWSTATPTVTPTWPPTVTPVPDSFENTSTVDLDKSSASAQDSSWDEGPSFLVVTPETATPMAVYLTATPLPRRVLPTATPSGFPGPSSQPPDRIVIQSIELDTTIVPVGWHVVEQNGQRYSVWDVAKYAASWHKTSAYPGHNGNVVLSGHNNILGEVFRYLIDVEVGERVLIYAGDLVYYYEVTEKHLLKEKGELPEVRRENARWISPAEDERLTMVTCWPYTGNSHRLVVVAKPIPAPLLKGLHE